MHGLSSSVESLSSVEWRHRRLLPLNGGVQLVLHAVVVRVGVRVLGGHAQVVVANRVRVAARGHVAAAGRGDGGVARQEEAVVWSAALGNFSVAQLRTSCGVF